MKSFSKVKQQILSVFACLFVISSMYGSSHREAPLISNDPLADNVDLYAFRSPDNPDMISIIATYVPLQLPQGGPNYYNFGQNIRYEIHVDNDAAVPGDEIVYRFTFDIVNEDPTTFFNIRLGQQNQKATYTLERSIDGGASFQTIVTDGYVPPNNIGPRSIEGAAGLGTTYDALFQNAITTSSTGETIFAGPTDDPFFVDLGGIFDLGDSPRQDGEPRDGVACYNVSAIAIQVPISTLLKAGAPATPTSILDSDYVIGVWASASRRAITTISQDNAPSVSGDWVQVSRIGMPLTNEAVIPIGDKDEWNALTPYNENPEHFEYFYNPELALYMDDSQFGGAVPAFAPLRVQSNSLGMFDFRNGADGLFSLKGNEVLNGTALDDAVFGTLLLPAAGKPRSVDLWPTFHTGVPNVIPYQLATGKAGNPLAAGKPFVNNFLPNGGDMLRLNMAVPPTPRDDPNFSSLGLVQAAAIGLTVAPFNTSADLEFLPNMDGFPNGRRLEDDVTRIELQAVAGVVLAAVGLWYDDYDPNSSPSPVTDDLLGVLTYTTGVEANDKAFGGSFPYLAQPHSGTGACSGELYFQDAQVAADVDAKVFVSSNNSGTVGLYGFTEGGNMTLSTFPAWDADADGIYYDEAKDQVIQLNRSTNRLNIYNDVASSLATGSNPINGPASSSDFSNGREIAVSGNSVVVAQDANGGNDNSNKFAVYTVAANGFTFVKSLPTSINLWGITFAGSDLIAIIDNSSDVAVFNNFLDLTGTVSPSRVITVDGIVRTHGLTYDVANDIMVLTDVGSGAVADDGKIVFVRNWSAVSADGRVSLAEQIVIAGPNTFLGNPVDVAYNHTDGLIYVAERANGGGRFLTFTVPQSSGNPSPVINEFFQGASAVHYTNCSDNNDGDPGSNGALVYYSLNQCVSTIGPSMSNMDYSEFMPSYPSGLSCGTVSAANVFRASPNTNKHSCTPGVAGSIGMCVDADPSCSYQAGSSQSLVFNVTINADSGEAVALSGFNFFEKAPTTYDWINGAKGTNDYPTKYGVRVLKDGVEVYNESEIPTSREWTLESFAFSGAAFTVTESSVFTFELLSYCLVGNGGEAQVWDIDEINVMGACAEASASASIAGQVSQVNGDMMEAATISADAALSEFPKQTVTDESGQYLFNNMPNGLDYTLQGSIKSGDHGEGVSTIDLILIYKHILDVSSFSDPYQLAASDINNDGKISVVDLVDLRKIILNLSSEFSNNDGWILIPEQGELSSQNLADVKRSIVISDLQSEMQQQNFKAIKVGDVNFDYSSELKADTRSDIGLDLTMDDMSVKGGQTYQLEVKAQNFTDISGFQFTLNTDDINIKAINGESISIDRSNMAVLNNEYTTVSWAEVTQMSVDNGEVLFTVDIEARADGMLSEMISLGSDKTRAEAYANDLSNTVQIGLIVEGAVANKPSYDLYDNVPNPFNQETMIGFNLAKAGQATISILDIDGKLIFSRKGNYLKGENQIMLNRNDIGGSAGVFFYRLDAEGYTMTKKMTVQ